MTRTVQAALAPADSVVVSVNGVLLDAVPVQADQLGRRSTAAVYETAAAFA
jgi:hypothetical protein